MPSATTISELQVVVNADTSPAESKLSSFGSSFGGMLAGGVVAAGAALAAGVAVGVKGAADLEQAVANISTIKPDIDTTAVTASLTGMSTRVAQSQTQLGEALYNVFSSVEVSQGEALELTEKFARGAVAAQTDGETFGTSIMGVMNAYGLSVKDADHISDVFFNTINKGVVTGDELAASLGPVTQSAKSAGVNIDELGAMIAAVTKEGGPAAQNINNLNNFLQKITTKEAQAQLEALGVKTKTATGEFRPTADVLTDLKEKLGGMTEAGRANALQAIFPDAQARLGAATLLSQLDLVKSVTEENTTATGVAAAAYEKMSATFNSQSKLLVNGLMAILTTIGGALLPALTPMVTAFSQWLPEGFAAAQAALAPLVATFQSIDWAGLSAMMSGLWALFTGDISFTSLMDLASILMSVFGPEAAQLILDFVDLSGQALRGLGAFIMEQFGTVVSWFQENMPLIQETIRVVLEQIVIFWENHGDAIVTVVQAAWTIVKTTIATVLANILDVIKIAMQLITGDWEGAWETFKGMVERGWEAIKTIFSAAFDAIYAVIDDRTDFALSKTVNWMEATGIAIADGWAASKEATSSGWEAITSTVTSAVDGVSSALSDAWKAIGDGFQSAWDGFLSTIETILKSIQTAIQKVWEQIPEDIRRDLEKIGTTLVERGAAWVTSVTTTGANMISAVSTWLATLVSDVTTWATSTFLAPIQGLVGTATTAATEVGTGMLTSLQAQFTAIVGAVTTWVSSFLAPITGLIGTATTAAVSVGSGILSSIQGKLNEVVGAVTTWAGSVLGAIQGLAGSVAGAAASIGQSIVSGIAGAINAGVGAIRDAAYRAARAALDAAKGALGIESPSKVFKAEVGRMIPAGIIEGVEAMARPLNAAMAGMISPPHVSAGYSGSGALGASAGAPQSMRLDLAIGGRVAESIYIEGRQLAIRRGRVPAGSA